jgi:multiple sugar transport system permease protein
MNSTPAHKNVSALLKEILYWITIALILFFFLFPLYWLFIASIKSPGDVTSVPPRFIPFLQFTPTLSNYQDVLSTTAMGAKQSFLSALINSVLISGSATIIAVLMGTLAAYTFSRFTVKGASDWLFFILSTRMLPPVVVIIPLFLMLSNLQLRNSFIGVTFLYITMGLPFVVWMMKGFFDEIPKEYEDAAMVDGYSRLEAVIKIVLPEALPAMLATAVFVLITAWNEFVFVTLLNSDKWKTVPPFLYQIIGYGRVEWARMAAAAMIFILPIVIFTFLVRNYLLRGVTFGAVRR